MTAMRAGALTIAEEHEVIRSRLEEVQKLADSIGEIPAEQARGAQRRSTSSSRTR